VINAAAAVTTAITLSTKQHHLKYIQVTRTARVRAAGYLEFTSLVRGAVSQAFSGSVPKKRRRCGGCQPRQRVQRVPQTRRTCSRGDLRAVLPKRHRHGHRVEGAERDLDTGSSWPTVGSTILADQAANDLPALDTGRDIGRVAGLPLHLQVGWASSSVCR
jgi:hypothetical protein